MIRRLIQLPASALCLFAAVITYGLLGSPTPDNPGIPEIAIGVFLLLAAGRGLSRFHDFQRPENLYFRLLHVVFLTGLLLPLGIGIFFGNDPALIVRDVTAFLFLCLPLFVARAFYTSEEAEKFLPWVLAFAGIAFALRTLVPIFHIWITGDELLYLSNSPLVLFTAIFLCAVAWKGLTYFSLTKLPAVIASFILIGVIIAAMLLDVQRATVAAVGISLLVLWGVTLIKTPKRILLPTLIICVAMLVFAPWLSDMAAALYKKTSEVGMNMRVQEAEAVLNALMANPVSVLLGSGWGGVFASPAVGGLDVNYTHSLLTTMFLKGGLIFAVLVLAFCVAGFYQIFLIFQRDSGKGLAVFWPFIIPILLYASHKSLDFGLLLLLIGVWSNRRG
jgi:hypothetical protein